MSLAELTREMDVPKSTLHRILTTLQAQRCVMMDDASKKYQLGPKLWELGSAFVEQLDLNSKAVPYMKRLAEACGESVFLGMMEEGHVVYIRQIESPKSVLAVRKLGQRAPAYCTATGLSIMAFAEEGVVRRLLGKQPLEAHTPNTVTSREEIIRRLEAVRESGVAVADGEYNAQLLCVSAPVLDGLAQVRASLTVAMLSEQATDERVRHAKEAVRQAAQDLSGELGFTGHAQDRRDGQEPFHETDGRFLGSTRNA